MNHRLVDRVVGVLLRLYPRRYRRAEGAELAEAYRTALRDADPSLMGRIRTLQWLLADAITTSWRVRRHYGHESRVEGMEMMREFQRIVRSLLRSPGFVVVTTLTLGLGIGANGAIFSVVRSLLLTPLPYEAPEQLVHLRNHYLGSGVMGWVSGPEFEEFRQETAALPALAAVTPDAANLTGLDTPLRLQGMRVTPGYFRLMGTTPLMGRTFTEGEGNGSEDPLVVVLSAHLWQQSFASDPQIVGKTVLLGGVAHTVVGVMSEEYSPLTDQVFRGRSEDFWRPAVIDPATFTGGTVERHNLFIIGRLGEGFDAASAATALDVAVDRLETRWPDISSAGQRGVAVTPLQEFATADVAPMVRILFWAVLLVLAVACVNVANLLAARADSRSQDSAVRASLGADSGRLVRRGLLEGAAIGVSGGIAGVVLTAIGIRGLTAVLPSSLGVERWLSVDVGVVSFAFLLSVLTGIIAGIMPAIRAARNGHLGLTLRDGGRNGTGRGVRDVLVVGQIGAAVVLVVGATLMVRSVSSLRSVDPGFDPTGVQLTTINGTRASFPDAPSVRAFYSQLTTRLEAHAGIESASPSWQTPLQAGMSDYPVMPDAGDASEWYSADPNLVGPDYFETWGIQLLEGRGFEPADAEAEIGPVILNRAAAERLWGDESAIGKRVNLTFGPPVWREVIGVVDDVRLRGLGVEARSQTYMSFGDGPWGAFPTLQIAVRGSLSTNELRTVLAAELADIDPDIPVGPIRPMSAQVSASIAREQVLSTFFTLFALLTLVLGAVGVYGIVSYSVERRTREIGLRLAMGAPRERVLRMMVRRGTVLGVLGISVGLGVAMYGSQLLESFLFGVERGDPLLLASVSLGVFMVALLAALIPAQRAARVDPMITLRGD